MRRSPWAAMVFGVLAPALARAWPVSGAVDLIAGTEQFVRQPVLAVKVDDPEIVTAEALPTGELLLTPKKPGRALLFLLGEGRLDAVRLRVHEGGGKSPEKPVDTAALALARKQCPGLKLDGPAGRQELEASIPNGTCRRALLPVLEADDLSADRLELAFQPEALQDQLQAMRAALAKRGMDKEVELAYAGPTLRLEGRLDVQRLCEILSALFEVVAGRLNLDDRTEASPDAGAAGSSKAPGPRQTRASGQSQPREHPAR